MPSAKFRTFAQLLIVAVLAMGSLARADDPVCVSIANAKLRKGPSTSFRVTWAVPKYMPLLAIGKKGTWLRVQDLEGNTHWVKRSSVSHRLSCAVVKTKSANLRSGPGYDQPLADVSSVQRYTPFLKVDRDGEWVQVKDTSTATYWVHETNIWIPMSHMQITF